MPEFVHLHTHTQYSLLDGAAKVGPLLDKAKADGMKGAAITDHGNMFGVFEFVNEAQKRDLIPIVGCEFYVTEDRHKKQFTKTDRDTRYHQLLLAKNEKGYRNLSKLCSLGYIEGLYSKWPRIDKELLLQYHEGIIATTCCIGAEVPQTIIHKGEEEGEKVFKWYLDLFGEDYYIELQRHHINDIDGTGISQEQVNQVLLKWADKYKVKVIATNDSHYIDQDDWNAHDILLCVNTGDLQATANRFKFHNDQFFFKTQQEMYELFSDIPEAVDNTMEIFSKIEPPEVKRDILLPNYTLPEGFGNEDDYLRHLTYEGAKSRYGELTAEITERLDFELKVIRDMGFAGYFLIVQDFCNAARGMGVSVGPGRGSAAGSAVAYCIGITNIDPIGYNLLFERFLNPERVSMPDIDIDFDDDGRQSVIDYVVNKYGQNQVAQIVTFGTMAARSSIRDVARVLDLPIPEADKIAKLVPSRPGTTLKGAYEEVKELEAIKKGKDLQAQTLRMAESLEGSVRHTGIHAAGVIIAPDDITKYIPVSTAKDAELWVTQFEGKYIEDAGMLKMDFLGLKTLSIIKDAVANIKKRHGIEIVPDDIPLDDEKTYELFQRGETVGIFQFESAGMQKYLKQLKPTNIEDLIAMNALYRPGPMDYIPSFIKRKQGQEEIIYPHELLKEILTPTYGIMVYQEQIMQTAQIIGGFSLGKADLLRRAMGKKKMEEMERQQVIFVEGAQEKGIEKKKAVEIFDIMKEFAKYGFNRSHSAAYSVLAYQTGYLKANYPAEFMASVLTHNKNDISKVNFFLSECKQLNVKALGPDINESSYNFTVNPKGEIRFALSAIKGVGGSAVEAILEERESGHFTSLFDLAKRVNLRSVNKKCIESLALSGAFDCFEGIHRAQYFFTRPGDANTLIENAVRFGQTFQKSAITQQNSLFGDAGVVVETADPEIPECEEWTLVEKLRQEKEVTGIYLSGHPLDDYKMELESFATSSILDIPKHRNRDLKIGGIVTRSRVAVSKRGNKFAIFEVEDFDGAQEMALFGEDFLKYKHLVEEPGKAVFITGRYQLRFKSEDQYEFRISNIELLAEVKDKLAKELIFDIDVRELDEALIAELEQLCTQYPGKYPLKVRLKDPIQHYEIGLFSHRYKVELNPEVFERLDQLKGAAYQLS